MPGVIPFIAGPTACGKSAVGLHLAERLGAEIVSADSRQVYLEMDIATDRPSPEDQRRVRHHLVGCRSVSEPLSAGGFARLAETALADITQRDRRAVVIGGSTLYLQALVFGLDETPRADEAVRQRLMDRLALEGPDVLYDELCRIDPSYAVTLDVTKTQRLIRGLEVHESSGRPLSSYFGERGPSRFPFRVFVLHRERRELYHRIDRRVSEMLDRGLVDEARALQVAGFDLEANPLRTIGYPEAAAFLRGDIDHDELRRQIGQNSRRYAKRQLTWYRRYDSFEWIDVSERDPESIAAAIARRLEDR